MNSKVSIIIPIYNTEKYLNRCIDSVLNQSYNNLEILLINDGSTDNSEKICKEYEKKYSRIKYIKKDNSGVSDTRNKGIKESSGKYIFFLDSDDYIDSGVIENLVNNYKNNILTGIIAKVIEEKNTYYIEKRNNKYSPQDFIKSILNSKINGYCWCYLYEKKLLKSIKFDNKIIYCEDVLFLCDYIYINNIKYIEYLNINEYYNYCFNPQSVTKANNNIINKLDSLYKSMNILNEKTNGKYKKYIENKKITLFEIELSKCSDKKVFKECLKKYKLRIYKDKSIQYKLFSLCYITNSSTILLGYYKLKKLIKKII